ncbi:Regulator of chromosome condensation [Macleaya cordata]|uniref:Regulator of chromosome condensation n=1 Tax=Macleaya cordata TaxID=56857 RepID=A0A200QQX2_MACCD|nr:Regulator of chromosome condensation [Macleaya cordata]
MGDAILTASLTAKAIYGSNMLLWTPVDLFTRMWGFGGLGRLGHREQKDEWSPRLVDFFQKRNVLPPDAVISAGSVSSACTAGLDFSGGGQMYMWGKIKNKGDEWMYPKPLLDLSGWNVRCMDSGSMQNFCGADDSCISWGHALYGELGYGPTGPKTSSNPKKVEILEGMHVISVACGMAHSMIVVDRTNVGDRLDQLDIYDGESASEGREEPEVKNLVAAKTMKKTAKAFANAKKRKNSKDSSEFEDEEKDGENDSEEDTNGWAEDDK